MLATGSAFWQTNQANYWGHNAIIRVEAFTKCCGLPVPKGNAPFGGEILSHDFVEASLLHRSGWDVLLLSDVEGVTKKYQVIFLITRFVIDVGCKVISSI